MQVNQSPICFWAVPPYVKALPRTLEMQCHNSLRFPKLDQRLAAQPAQYQPLYITSWSSKAWSCSYCVDSIAAVDILAYVSITWRAFSSLNSRPVFQAPLIGTPSRCATTVLRAFAEKLVPSTDFSDDVGNFGSMLAMVHFNATKCASGLQHPSWHDLLNLSCNPSSFVARNTKQCRWAPAQRSTFLLP